MANERQQRLMQEALDEQLSPQQVQELTQELDQDAEGSAQFRRLKRVDTLLRAAPHERAPERLALRIMARLAESIKAQPMSRTSSLALALGLSLVMLVTMPFLIAAVALFLSAVGSAGALSQVLQAIVSLLLVVVAMLEAGIAAAQNMMATTPQAPLLLVALVPVILLWLVRYVFGNRSEDDKG
jgi:anti-sigma factor RsiW